MKEKDLLNPAMFNKAVLGGASYLYKKMVSFRKKFERPTDLSPKEGQECVDELVLLCKGSEELIKIIDKYGEGKVDLELKVVSMAEHLAMILTIFKEKKAGMDNYKKLIYSIHSYIQEAKEIQELFGINVVEKGVEKLYNKHGETLH